MNSLDLLIVGYLAYFLFLGYIRGFIRQSISLLSLVLSFGLSLKFYSFVGSFFVSHYFMPTSFANVVALFAIWFSIQFIFYTAVILFYHKIPKELHDKKWNRWGGLAPAFIKGLAIIILFLGTLNIFPVNNYLDGLIKGSLVGRQSIKVSGTIGKYVNNIFGGAINDTANFLTVKRESNEFFDLGYKVPNPRVDAISEDKMLDLINKERVSLDLTPLVMDDSLLKVARAHSLDMFVRGYFSHNTPDGQTPFDRMDTAGIKYMIAGENLALAPTVDIAHQGLMNSPGHKANILTPEFRKVGLGVMDGGVYGKMFSQEFTD